MKERLEWTEYLCPISGHPLYLKPKDSNALDAPLHYQTEDGEYHYVRDPRRYVFSQVYDGNSLGLNPISNWLLKDNGDWVQVEWIEELSGYFPLDVDPEAIKVLIENQRLKQELSDYRFRERLHNGELTLPIAKEVAAKPIGFDLVPVQPMSEPTSSIMSCVDTSNDTYMGKSYPIKVTSSNIESVREEWDLEKYDQHELYGSIQPSDEIHWWETGGPLSTRAGEAVIREGKVIYKKLKIMS